MKHYLLLLLFAFTASTITSQNVSEEDVSQLKREVANLRQQVSNQRSVTSNQQRTINALQSELSKSKAFIDTLQSQIGILSAALSSAEERFGTDITKTNQSIEDHANSINGSISTKSFWGIVIMLAFALLAALGYYLLRRKVSSSDEAINAVKEAQKKLEEESVKLDNQLIDVLTNQINAQSVKLQSVQTQLATPDHSLVLKVADEITRIELNLSRMDPSVKGLKQLSKGVERIKNNYLSKGYEIADMLNKPYNEGMRINADFVLDEKLEPGTRIITSITKPQVIYKGELIQKAIVTVTQNI